MAPSVGRRFSDATQRLKGRQPLRFQLELIPYFADGVPSHIKKASFLWQRGPKLQFTDFVESSAAEGIVHWDQVLKQTSTMYRDGNTFAQKEYSFKLQGVKGDGKDEKPTTFAKTQIDLAAYCSCETSGTRDLIVELRPSGRLHVGVVATWLKNSAPEQDSLTDLSYMSIGPSGPSSTIAGDQDLSGFDDNAALKAAHGSPLKKVAFSQSLSMPTPRRGAAVGPAATERDLRSVKSFAHPQHGEAILGTPALQRTSLPALQVDTPRSFAGFQTIPLEENELITPTIPRKTRGDLRANLHRKSKSEPLTPDAMSIPENEPCSPPAPERNSADLEEAYNTLLSSESEDEVGPVASVRRWWTGKKPKRPQSALQTPFGDDSRAAAREAELEAIASETDVEALRARCRALMEERDAAVQERAALKRKILRMDRDVEALELAKRGMQERLAVSEDRLMRLTRDETMTSLVQAKLKLAQTDYSNLELQGQLTQERMRVQTLRSKLTHMEAQYHATLDRISAASLIPAHRAFIEDHDGGVVMSCLPFSGGGGGRPKQLPAPAAPRSEPAAPSPSLPAPARQLPAASEPAAEVAGGQREVAGDLAVSAGNGACRADVGERALLPVSTAMPVG